MDLYERIRSNAARRLQLPSEGGPVLSDLKRFLKDENWRTAQSLQMGLTGREITAARTEVIDQILVYLAQTWSRQNPQFEAKGVFALVAVGGYGRHEMAPSSDVDLLILHDGSLIYRNRITETAKQLSEAILHPLYDLRFKVGHSLRSVDECVLVANEDPETKTALVESRLIYGSAKLFERFQTTFLKRCVHGHEEAYIQFRLDDQKARRKKHGRSPLVQTPNIKNGCGGLRDYQSLIWITFFRYQTLSLDELVHKGLVRQADINTLERAYDYLLRTRYYLHLEDPKSVDVMDRHHQIALSERMGYESDDEVKRLEAFMRDYYDHVKQIDHWSRTLETQLDIQPQPRKRPSFRQVIHSRSKHKPTTKLDGFEIEGSYLKPANAKLFEEKPRRIMRVFLYQQQRGLSLHPDLTNAIHDHLHMVNQKFRCDPRVHKTFLEILSHRGSVGASLRTMHDVGVLGRFLPEFGRLRLLVHHEFLHHYTVDEHTLRCIDALDHIWESEDRMDYRYQGLVRDLQRPSALYMALLLHDAGKALDAGPHEESGEVLSEQVGRRIGLPEKDIALIQKIVRHHLLLVQTSQRCDLEDPDVIEMIADSVGDIETLDMLTIHTYCDSLGTGPNLWTEFKDALMWNLYFKTQARLQAGGRESQETLCLTERKSKIQEALSDSVETDEVEAMFATLPARYFSSHEDTDIQRDIVLIHEFLERQVRDDLDPLAPILRWEPDEDRAFSRLYICTWNRAGLFYKAAGCLTCAGLTILSADINSRSDGIGIDTYIVADAFSGRLPTPKRREKFQNLFSQALTSDLDLDKMVAAQRKRVRHSGANVGVIPPVVSTRQEHELYNVIEVTADDDLGLLYTVTKTLTEFGLDIWIARVFTEMGAAVDTFFVAEIEGEKIRDRNRLEEISEALIAAIKHDATPKT